MWICICICIQYLFFMVVVGFSSTGDFICFVRTYYVNNAYASLYTFVANFYMSRVVSSLVKYLIQIKIILSVILNQPYLALIVTETYFVS